MKRPARAANRALKFWSTFLGATWTFAVLILIFALRHQP